MESLLCLRLGDLVEGAAKQGLAVEVRYRRLGPTPEVVQLPQGGVPLREIERQAITQALRQANGIQTVAARLLGVTPRVMSYKLARMRLAQREGEND